MWVKYLEPINPPFAYGDRVVCVSKDNALKWSCDSIDHMMINMDGI